ncbi:MAG: hypothetical protein KAS57_02305 [Gammaproteobacteria bacterium]|nr:hypothetical protein [Gammaproteobacteria bacterium]
MLEEDEYHSGHRIGRPLGFLGRIDGTLDCGREVLDKHAADSSRYHCGDPGHSQPFFNPGGLLGIPHPTFISARLLS